LTSLYTGLVLSTALIILGPAVWVDVIHKDEKAAVERRIKDFETGSKQTIGALEKQKAAGRKLTQIDAAIAGERMLAEAKRKELNAAMPKAIFPMNNPAVISMAFSFLSGILVSLLFPEKEAQTKFDDEKLRVYVGIGMK